MGASVGVGDEKSLTNLGSFRETVYNHVKPGIMNFGLQWDLPEPLRVTSPEDKTRLLFSTSQLTLNCTVGENGSDRLVVSRLEYGLPGHQFTLTRKGQSAEKYATGQ